MSDLATFFTTSTSALGVFYPLHYIIATFSDDAISKEAVERLHRSGIPEAEAMAATALEVVTFFRSFRKDAGLLGDIMRPLSRFIDTEAVFSDANITQAKAGVGFAAIHCETEEKAAAILDAFQPQLPDTAVWYIAGGVRSLI
jgi:hypothetical protein